MFSVYDDSTVNIQNLFVDFGLNSHFLQYWYSNAT